MTQEFPSSPPSPSQPHAEAIQPSSVYECRSLDEARRLIAGELPGHLYSREGHPNGDSLAAACAAWHATDEAIVTGSGMAALALAMLVYLESGDHLLVSNRLYGRSLVLFRDQATRLGMTCTIVDTCDLSATKQAITARTKMLVAETITNPMLRVTDIGGLARLCEPHGVTLLVDNTFASPTVCRPLELGATVVMESITKFMNGHSDVMLGLLCGGAEQPWERIRFAHSTWGFMASPFDCWLASRGLTTLRVRAEAAHHNALAVAKLLSDREEVAQVSYPGLAAHPDHALAKQQFADRFGTIVTFELASEANPIARRRTAEQFILAASERGIPFCPSLGEAATTLSHPAATSHRSHTEEQLAALGIRETTIRLSCGIEETGELLGQLAAILQASRERSDTP